jgi:hypothetical protein
MARLWVVVAMLLLLPRAAFAEGEEEPAAPRAATDDEDPTPKKKKKAVEDDDDPTPKKKGKKAKPAEESASVSASSEDLVPQGSPKGRMTLPGGKFMFNVVTETNMAKGAAGKPIGIAPDLWIGFHDKLTLGIYHSGRAATGFLSGFGRGLCVNGGPMKGICALGKGKIYTFVGSEARIGLSEGGLALALVLGGNATFLGDDTLISGKGGFLARIHGKRLAIELSPMVFPGITKRKVGGMDFNTDKIAVPLTIFIRFAPRVSFALQAGVTSTLKKFGDNRAIPAAAGLAFWLTPHISFDAAFGLANLAPKEDATGNKPKAFDARSITVGLGYAL